MLTRAAPAVSAAREDETIQRWSRSLLPRVGGRSLQAFLAFALRKSMEQSARQCSRGERICGFSHSCAVQFANNIDVHGSEVRIDAHSCPSIRIAPSALAAADGVRYNLVARSGGRAECPARADSTNSESDPEDKEGMTIYGRRSEKAHEPRNSTVGTHIGVRKRRSHRLGAERRRRTRRSRVTGM